MATKIDLELLPEYLLAFGEKIKELDFAGYDSFLAYYGNVNSLDFWVKSKDKNKPGQRFIDETLIDYKSFSDFMENCFKKANKLINK